MVWTIGITQWSLPGNAAYTLQLARQLGFDAVQLEFGSLDSGMPLLHKRLRDLYLKDSQALGIRLLPLTVNALCRYGVVNGFATPDGKIARDTILAALDTAAAMGMEGVTMPSFGANEIHTRAHYEHTVEALRFSCEQAAARGLTVYTENVLDAQGWISSSVIALPFSFAFCLTARTTRYLDTITPWMCSRRTGPSWAITCM
jgi:sugar phosphate isomerase/epimerase